MIDERIASWKLLLSTSGEDRGLAYQASEAVVTSLRRTFNDVDVLPEKGSKYDWLVLPEDCAETTSLQLIDNHLADDGLLVLFNRKQSGRLLKKQGFQAISHYGGVPSSQPRIMLPLQSHSSRDLGLTFHSPGSLRGKIGVVGARILSRLGMTNPLTRWNVSILTRDSSTKQHRNRPTLRNWLEQQLGFSFGDFIIYAGSESPNRKITLLLPGLKGASDYVCKISDTELGREAIELETKALQRLEDSRLSSCVPQVKLQGLWQRYFVQVQSINASPSKPSGGKLTPSHMRFLVDLSFVEEGTTLLRETQLWRDVLHCVEVGQNNTQDTSPGMLAIRRAISYCKGIGLPEMRFPTHCTHGDYASWNIKRKYSDLFVYDWEDSRIDGNVLFDIFHFIVRHADLVGPWPGAERLLSTVEKYAVDLLQLRNWDHIDWRALFLVWLVWEYSKTQSSHVIELIEELL